MLEIKFSLQWIESLKEWRVYGSDGTYASAPSAEAVPKAIRTMLKSEAGALLRAAEQD